MPALSTMTWCQIQQLQRDCPLLALPLGATEQHGPALPTGTDTIIAEALCREACGRAGVPYAPPLPLTSSGAHSVKWPGTFSITPLTLIETLVQFARWASATGWQKVYIINAHAGNSAPLKVAVDQIRLELLGKLQIGAADTFSLTPEIARRFTEDAVDLHANKAECDLLLHIAPELVNRETLSSADDPDRTGGLVFSYPVSQTSLNGTTGSPSAGNAKDGAELFELMVAELVKRLKLALIETPPLAAEHWQTVPPNFFY